MDYKFELIIDKCIINFVWNVFICFFVGKLNVLIKKDIVCVYYII